VGAAVRVRFPGWAEPRRAVVGLAAALCLLASAATAGASLPGLVVVSLVPFALAGILLSDAYASRGSTAARATYAIDLFAAASGCLVAPRVIGALALALVERRARSVAAVALVAAANVGLLVTAHAGYLPDGPLAVLLASDP